jgi:hypothetical protein
VRGDLEAVEVLERGYAEGGFHGAYSRLAEWQAAHWPRPWVYPLVWAGKTQQALDRLEREFEERDPHTPYLGVNYAKSLRDEPRFQDLLRRMNLPEDVIARILND